ncbi:hypothetical protein F5884DRAFT_344007 [Xylogone sp. PMI_703]|nr:hypothetical protein F5884DRAFT_344007 [Xylogone sp. PMI_703]
MDTRIRRKPVPSQVYIPPRSDPLSNATQHRDNTGGDQPIEDIINSEEQSFDVSEAFIPRSHGNNSEERLKKSSAAVVVSGYSPTAGEPQVDEFPPHHKHVWNSFWLRLPALATLSIAFASVAAASLILYFVSKDRSGFRPITTNHYSWTYGPTALLVIIAALWNRVNYQVKSLAPWYNLRRAACKPERSILLDYVSPLSILSMFRAAKHRDWAVFAVTSVSLLLKLATIISTSFISLEPTLMIKQNSTLLTKLAFDASNFTIRAADSSPAYIFYGATNLGLPYPNGTLDSVMVPLAQPLKSYGFPSNSTISWQADAFYPSFDCQKGSWNLTQPNPQDYALQFNATVSTNDCHVTTKLSAIDGTQLSKFRSSQSYPGRNFVSTIQSITCNTTTDPNRYLLTVSQTNQNLKVTNFSAAICVSGYHLMNSDVILDGSIIGGKNGLSANPVDGSPKFTIDNLTSGNLGDAVMNVTQMFFLRATNAQNISENVTPFFGLMTSLSHPAPGTSTLEAFLDTDVMMRDAQNAFNGVAVQFAARNLLTPSGTNSTGVVLFQENRLHVQRVSAVLIAVILILALCLSVAVSFFRPWDILPRDPNTITGIAVLLRSGIEFKRLLSGTGRLSLPALASHLSGQEFRGIMTSETAFLIKPMEPSRYETDRINKPARLDDQSMAWWRPLGARLYIRVISLVLPLVVIAILEALQHKSDYSDGFANVGSDNKSTKYAIAWLPALAMFGITALYGTVNFAACVLAPYHALWKGSQPAGKSISVNTIGKSPVVSFIHAAKAGFWAVCATALSVFLASFLTIIVSGLYTIDRVTTSTNITASQLDNFDFTWANSANNDSAAGSLTGLILWSNLSYPIWTYKDLVFPSLDIGPQTILSTSQSLDSVLTTTIPAIRARLNCTTSAPVSITASSEYFISMNATYLDTCSGNKLKTGYFQLSVLANSNNTQIIGGIQDLHVSSFNGTSIANTAQIGNVNYPNNPEGCPSLVFYLGQFFTSPPDFSNDNGDEESLERVSIDANVSLLVCTQALQQVQTRTTFLMPDFDIDPSNPPETDESTAVYIANGTEGRFIREYQILNNIVAEFPDQNIDAVDYNPGVFYSAAISGKDGVPVEELLGSANVDKFVNATSNIYSQYMAQAISLNMRETNSVNTVKSLAATFPATLSQPSHLRLKQNKASKITLQVFLGVMFLCGVAAWLLMDTRDLLTHNPCSIAGTASFLADSKIWEDDGFFRDEEGIQNVENRENKGLLKGKLFSLGWWSEEREGTTRFGIDVGNALRRIDSKR